MSRICPLFSGSTGNSTYIGTRFGGIIVDAGASLKGITAALEIAGGALEEIKAVAITHEHIDHVKGLKPLLNKTDAVVIASTKTLEALIAADKIPGKTEVLVIDEGESEICGTVISRFATSHDCEGSSGFSFILPESKKITLCTDLGIVTDTVRDALTGSDLVLLESNHDIDMLKRGPYPPELKVRIMGEKGHISNNVCAAEIVKLMKQGTQRFVLCHLSQKNNTPLLARSASEAALMDLGAKNGKDYLLSVAAVKENGVIVL